MLCETPKSQPQVAFFCGGGPRIGHIFALQEPGTACRMHCGPAVAHKHPSRRPPGQRTRSGSTLWSVSLHLQPSREEQQPPQVFAFQKNGDTYSFSRSSVASAKDPAFHED